MNTFLLHNKCTVGDIKKEKKNNISIWMLEWCG